MIFTVEMLEHTSLYQIFSFEEGGEFCQIKLAMHEQKERRGENVEQIQLYLSQMLRPVASKREYLSSVHTLLIPDAEPKLEFPDG